MDQNQFTSSRSKFLKLDYRCAPCGPNGLSGQSVQQPAAGENKLGLGSVYYPKGFKDAPGIIKNQGMPIIFFYLIRIRVFDY